MLEEILKSYLMSRINDLKEDVAYSPLSDNDIIDLVYNNNIVPRLDTTVEDYRKFQEIEFFASNDISGNTKSIFDSINYTFSITGKLALKHYFTDIVHNNTDLIMRQNQIKTTHTHQDVFTHYLKEFKDIENEVYWHLKEKTQEFKDVVSTLYFQNKWLNQVNNNSKLLNIYYFFLIIWTPLWGLLGPVVFFIIPFMFSKYVLKVPIPFKFYIGQLKEMLFGKQFFRILEVVKQGFTLMSNARAGITTSLSSKIKYKAVDMIFSIILSPVGRWIYFAILLLGYFWSITNSIIAAWNMNKFTNFIHNRIKTLYKLFNICNALNKYYPINTILNTSNYSDYINLDNTNKFKLLETIIINNLEFSKPSTLFTFKGDSLTLYWKIFNDSSYISYINSRLYYLGIIDKLTSLSYLISIKRFTFCNYSDNTDKPLLNCVNMFNPIFNSNYTTNNIYLTTNEPLDYDNVELLDHDNFEPLETVNVELLETDTVDTSNVNVEPIESDNVEPIESDNVELLDTDNVELLDTDNVELLEPVNEAIESDSKPNLKNELKANLKNELKANLKNELKATDNLLDYNQNCILTGPNGSGKSSLLKTILMNIIFAQSVGIVSADNITLTPFKYISSYLNIADAQGKESLFQAEMSRCHMHLTRLKELEDDINGFSFNIMDEIFVSTNYFEGVSGAYGVIKSLDNMKKSINIITTHFDKLTEPENRCKSYCYKYFTISDNGEKDYILRTGINNKHLALNLLQEKGFDDELCNNAKNFYIKLKSIE